MHSLNSLGSKFIPAALPLAAWLPSHPCQCSQLCQQAQEDDGTQVHWQLLTTLPPPSSKPSNEPNKAHTPILPAAQSKSGQIVLQSPLLSATHTLALSPAHHHHNRQPPHSYTSTSAHSIQLAWHDIGIFSRTGKPKVVGCMNCWTWIALGQSIEGSRQRYVHYIVQLYGIPPIWQLFLVFFNVRQCCNSKYILIFHIPKLAPVAKAH